MQDYKEPYLIRTGCCGDYGDESVSTKASDDLCIHRTDSWSKSASSTGVVWCRLVYL